MSNSANQVFNRNFAKSILKKVKKDKQKIDRVITSDNEWQRGAQRVTMNGTTNDNKWQQVVERTTTSDIER